MPTNPSAGHFLGGLPSGVALRQAWRKPAAILVAASLLVAAQGPACEALAQTISSPNTGKSAPISLQIQAVPGLSAPVSPASFSDAKIPLAGSSIGDLPAAPGIMLGRRIAAPAVSAVPAAEAVPVLAEPAVSQAQVETNAAAAPALAAPAALQAQAPRAAPEQTGEASPAAHAQTSVEPGKSSELKGLARLTSAIARVGASLSLRKFYDNDSRTEEAAPSAFDPASVKIYLTRDGADPVQTDLAALGGVLKSDPRYLASLNKSGRVRVVLSENNPSGGLKGADVASIRRTMRSYGVTSRVDVEKLAVQWAKKAPQPGAQEEEAKRTGSKSALWRYLIGPVTAPLREIAYVFRTLKTSFSKPSLMEVLGGLASKAPPFIMGLAWWAKTFLPGHPMIWLGAVGYSLLLNVFHGVFIDTWNTFQNRIGRQRGIQYQTFFNFLYGQIPGMIFRTLVWSVVAGTIPPWSALYWRDIGITTIVGTFCGTLGYQGLNGLYNKGVMSRGWRSGFQQVRDLFFCLSGVFFGTGSMYFFWIFFVIQQAMDVALYVVSRRMASRSIAYAADASVAATPEFQGMYPVRPGPEESPLKQALKAILDNPLFKVIVYAGKAVGGLFKRKP